MSSLWRLGRKRIDAPQNPRLHQNKGTYLGDDWHVNVFIELRPPSGLKVGGRDSPNGSRVNV